MTIVANTSLTYTANNGQREDLSDVIYNISPTDTPFMTRIAKTKATAVLHEWQTDSLAAPAANAQIEGDDTTFPTQRTTSRINNRCQISNKAVIVAGTLDAVSLAGRKKETAYQVSLRMKELKRDQEYTLTQNQAPVTGNSTTARVLRSLEAWYTTNVDKASDGTNGTTSAARGDGTQRGLTEAMLKNVMQSAWAAGGEPSMLMVGPKNKLVVSSFAGNATRMDKSEDKKLFASIDVYESDFGPIEIVPNRFSRDRSAHLIQPDMWALAVLRPVQLQDLAKTGDADKKLIVTEYTLEARNEASSGIIADLTTP